MSLEPSGDKCERMKCPGIMQQSAPVEEPVALKPAGHCCALAKTCLELSPSYMSPSIFQEEYPPLSGIECSGENPSTSTKSCCRCTLSSLMKRERDAWAQLRLCFQWQNQKSRSKPEPNGHQLSKGCLKQSLSFFPTDETNSSSTLNISKGYSPPNTSELIPKSSSMINQSVIRSEDRIYYSPTTAVSGVSVKPSFMLMELSIRGKETEKAPQREKDLEKERGRKRFAEDLMDKQDVDSLKRSAITSISARDAERVDMGNPPALQRSIRGGEYGMRLKYLRYNIWDLNSDFSPNMSDWMKTAAPLEGPPQSELDDEAVKKTIRDNPDLFKIITPIHVDVFESYLSTHPNCPFVESVCRGLREGFWPWAKTPCPSYPSTNDESKGPPSDVKRAEFCLTRVTCG